MSMDDWYREFFELNPKQRRWRDLVVEYAESKGGLVLEYLRRSNPEFWFDTQPVSFEGASLGLKPEDEARIVSEMWRTLLPVFRASPEYSPPPSQLQRPQLGNKYPPSTSV